MASRAISVAGGVSRATGRAPQWRAVLRRSMRRSVEIGGAIVLLGLMLFMGAALASYHQTDPSSSTAAGGAVLNWMGAPGAWAADAALLSFGPVCALFLPLLYVFSRKLWRLVEEEDGDLPELHQRWWRPLGLLLFAMALLSTVLALLFTTPGGTLPASMGGLAGLVGASAIRGLAGFLPDILRIWAILAAGLTCLIAGAILAGRVFAVDWISLLTLPMALRRARAPAGDTALAFAPVQEKRDKPVREEKQVGEPLGAPRKPPEISDPSRPTRPAQITGQARQGDLFDAYELPSLDLLDDPKQPTQQKIDKLGLERNARLLETVLDDFNVKGEITAVRTGPVVTMYELEPAPGIKASRVIGLADDIARNMSAISARVSSIPGRTVMGIELPNADRQMVNFKEMVGSEAFAGHKGLLPIILGKDIAGEPIVADLAAMPHLLVAGTTGSGKSVGLNTILLSLLYRLTPQQCRLILVDPKVLELKSYDDIPHLLSPVVTEPAKAVRALKWAVEEMERRYRMMSEISVRNISGFNDKVRTAIAKGKPLGRRIQIGFDPDTGEELFEETQLDYRVIPQIVIIVDELADLMVTCGKEIEVLIQRLSQKSRAAGIHLIMATQRPSVDVITGVIKANLPTRVSFAVTSRIDSRTILGEQGAEQLLGKGDMLYKPSSDPVKRVHGPFVSDEEVERVADHWRTQGSPEYIDSVTEEPEDGGFGFDDIDSASDSPEERTYRGELDPAPDGRWLQHRRQVDRTHGSGWLRRPLEPRRPAGHLPRQGRQPAVTGAWCRTCRRS
jgi:S-DNA-T family DNA segregation ATPase FtsK/SpoIIIE